MRANRPFVPVAGDDLTWDYYFYYCACAGRVADCAVKRGEIRFMSGSPSQSQTKLLLPLGSRSAPNPTSEAWTMLRELALP
uniref:Uncharacterized protein n=1 Tax=Oryza punctata TaxID=4537 RepID=A0A0E0LRI0_ORYPU